MHVQSTVKCMKVSCTGGWCGEESGRDSCSVRSGSLPLPSSAVVVGRRRYNYEESG